MSSIERSYADGAATASLGKLIKDNVSPLTQARAKRVGALFGQVLAGLAVVGAVALTAAAIATGAGAAAIIGCLFVTFVVSACAYWSCKRLENIKDKQDDVIAELTTDHGIKKVVVPYRKDS